MRGNQRKLILVFISLLVVSVLLPSSASARVFAGEINKTIALIPDGYPFGATQTMLTGTSLLSDTNLDMAGKKAVSVTLQAEWLAATPGGRVELDVMSSSPNSLKVADISKLDTGAFLGNIDLSFPTLVTANADATGANKLHDANGGFVNTMVGQVVKNSTDGTTTTVTAFVDSGELTLNDDIFVSGETYILGAIKQETLDISPDAAFLWLRIVNNDSGSVKVIGWLTWTDE